MNGSALGVATWETIDVKGEDGMHVPVTAMTAHNGPQEREEVLGDVIGWLTVWDEQRRGVIYVSGDTVLFEELQEIPRRYHIETALLQSGAAPFDVFGPAYLTFTAAEGARFAKTLGETIVIPLHNEGWAHFTEGRTQIEQAFAVAGREKQLHFLPIGQPVPLDAEPLYPENQFIAASQFFHSLNSD